jgi:hypothetical protein
MPTAVPMSMMPATPNTELVTKRIVITVESSSLPCSKWLIADHRSCALAKTLLTPMRTSSGTRPT